MEVRVLRYFLAVAREENITRAAEILHITQPTLSRQLMALEDELGVQLFVRGKTHISLTQDGMLLRRRAEEIVSLVDKTESEIGNEDMIEGSITIGAGEFMVMRDLVKVLKTYHEKYPGVTFDMISGNADETKDQINSGLVDLGLLLEPVNIEHFDYLRMKKKERWGLVVRQDHPLAKRETIHPEDIYDEPLILSKRALVQEELAHWFKKPLNEMHIIGSLNLNYNASFMVEEGLASMLTLDKESFHYEGSPLVFRPLEPALERGVVLVWKKHQIFTPAMNKLMLEIKRIGEKYE